MIAFEENRRVRERVVNNDGQIVRNKVEETVVRRENGVHRQMIKLKNISQFIICSLAATAHLAERLNCFESRHVADALEMEARRVAVALAIESRRRFRPYLRVHEATLALFNIVLVIPALIALSEILAISIIIAAKVERTYRLHCRPIYELAYARSPHKLLLCDRAGACRRSPTVTRSKYEPARSVA